MERKTKHRILGIAVVIALGIIIYPLFQIGKDNTPQVTSIKAPQFPDQSIQLPEANATPITQVAPLPSVDTSPIINTAANIPAATPQPTVTPSPNPIVIAQKKVTKVIKPSIKAKDLAIKMQAAALLRMPIDDDGLIKLKDAAWVIQIGSFKNKTVALRLVNQLRARGYRAFIQQISNNDENLTRVYIGPEQKQTSAHALASQLKSDMHIDGIVISYKPLTL